jgi:hypothetical protein
MICRSWMHRSTASATILNAHGTRVSGHQPDAPIFGIDYLFRGFCKIPEVLAT